MSLHRCGISIGVIRALVALASVDIHAAAAQRDSAAIHEQAYGIIDRYERQARSMRNPAAGPCFAGPAPEYAQCASLQCNARPEANPCFMGREHACDARDTPAFGGVSRNVAPVVGVSGERTCRGNLTDQARDSVELWRQRDAMLDSLRDLLAAGLDGTWIRGQVVYYLVESGRWTDAVSVTDGCANPRAWCERLRGYVLARSGAQKMAEAAFARAASIDPGERCRLDDAAHELQSSDDQVWARGPSYEPGVFGMYIGVACSAPERTALDERIWWLSDPSWIVDGNDRRLEHMVRQVEARLVSDWLVAVCQHPGGCFVNPQLRVADSAGRAGTTPERDLRNGLSDSWWVGVVPAHQVRTPSGDGRAPSGLTSAPGHDPYTTVYRDSSGRTVGSGLSGAPRCEIAWSLNSRARYHFVIDDSSAVMDPLTLSDSAWHLDAGGPPQFPALPLSQCNQFPPERYTPAYANRVSVFADRQIAFFRRGDSALVVAAFDLERDSLFRRLSMQQRGASTASQWLAGLVSYQSFANGDGPRDSARSVAWTKPIIRWQGMLAARWDSLVAGFEVIAPLNADSGFATTQSGQPGTPFGHPGALGRTRFAAGPPPEPVQRLQLSDILIDSAPPDQATLAGVAPYAFGTTAIPRAIERVTLFWEEYGVDGSDRETAELVVEPLGTPSGLVTRLWRSLTRALPPRPVDIQWTEVAARGPITGRALRIDTRGLAPGVYRMSLAVRAAGQQPVRVSRVIRVEGALR